MKLSCFIISQNQHYMYICCCIFVENHLKMSISTLFYNWNNLVMISWLVFCLYPKKGEILVWEQGGVALIFSGINDLFLSFFLIFPPFTIIVYCSSSLTLFFCSSNFLLSINSTSNLSVCLSVPFFLLKRGQKLCIVKINT